MSAYKQDMVAGGLLKIQQHSPLTFGVIYQFYTCNSLLETRHNNIMNFTLA
jgi:hypothetical protein